MVHADAALLPTDLHTKADFYSHLKQQLSSLLSGQRAWITNLSNASSVLHASLNAWRARARSAGAGDATHGKPLNWTGFYLLSGLFPEPRPALFRLRGEKVPTVVLGPFHGLPACQAIPSVEGRGVCADGSARLPPQSIRVPRTDDYPGHIACDSLSKSELVIPLAVPVSALSPAHAAALSKARTREAHRAAGSSHADDDDDDDDLLTAWSGRGAQGDDTVIVGLLDIDCVQEDGFDDEDQRHLEECVQIIVQSCAW